MTDAFTGHVYGRVQGVGFRFYIRNKAISLNITGWVRNLNDGSVEILANGPLNELEQFMHAIKTGNVGSRVDKVEFQWFQSERAIKTFEIRG
jgi:acylphosphatase